MIEINCTQYPQDKLQITPVMDDKFTLIVCEAFGDEGLRKAMLSISRDTIDDVIAALEVRKQELMV